MLERIRVMVARKRGPKKGHGLRPLAGPLVAPMVAEEVVHHEVEAGEEVVVGV
jgi:hypothetical protein